MARIVIIGGAGHVGTFLVPRLVEAGHQVVNVTRGLSRPWLAHKAWAQVEQLVIDRTAEDAAGRFGAAIAALTPDIVIDMICFTPASAAQLADALEGRV